MLYAHGQTAWSVNSGVHKEWRERKKKRGEKCRQWWVQTERLKTSIPAWRWRYCPGQLAPVPLDRPPHPQRTTFHTGSTEPCLSSTDQKNKFCEHSIKTNNNNKKNGNLQSAYLMIQNAEHFQFVCFSLQWSDNAVMSSRPNFLLTVLSQKGNTPPPSIRFWNKRNVLTIFNAFKKIIKNIIKEKRERNPKKEFSTEL